MGAPASDRPPPQVCVLPRVTWELAGGAAKDGTMICLCNLSARSFLTAPQPQRALLVGAEPCVQEQSL